MPILDVKAASVPTGGTVVETGDPTDGGLNVHLVGGVALATAPQTAPAVVVYTLGALPGASAWLAGASVTVGTLRRVSWQFTYTGNGAGAQVGFEVQNSLDGAAWSDEPLIDSGITVSGTMGLQNAFGQAIALPVSGATPLTWTVVADVAGEYFVRLRVRELVASGGAGSVTAKQGGSY